MTSFNTGAGKDSYFLHFETDDKEKYLYMQEQARKCIDNAYITDFAPVVHAHWIKVEKYPPFYKCSNCNVWVNLSLFLYRYLVTVLIAAQRWTNRRTNNESVDCLRRKPRGLQGVS